MKLPSLLWTNMWIHVSGTCFHPTLSDLWNCACSRLFLLGKSFSNGKKHPANTGEVSQYPRVLPVVRWSEDRLRHTLGAPDRSCTIYFWRRYGGTRSTCQHGSLSPINTRISWETVKETNGDEGFGDHEKGLVFTCLNSFIKMMDDCLAFWYL